MKALRDHLQRMHNKNWIVQEYRIVGDSLIIDFREQDPDRTLLDSERERDLAGVITNLEIRGFHTSGDFVEVSSHTVVHLLKKGCTQTGRFSAEATKNWIQIPGADINAQPTFNIKGTQTGRFSAEATKHKFMPNTMDAFDRERLKDQCETCQGLGTIDERDGGIATSNPEAPCPDCTPLIGCPDCQDGYYYPLFGERESCQTCS